MLHLKLKLFVVVLLIDIVDSVLGLFTELMVLINDKTPNNLSFSFVTTLQSGKIWIKLQITLGNFWIQILRSFPSKA